MTPDRGRKMGVLCLQEELPQTSRRSASASAQVKSLLPTSDKVSVPRAPFPKPESASPALAPDLGELIPTASADSRGQVADSASHWPRSRLDADWLRLSAAAPRGSGLAQRSGHWCVAAGLRRLPGVKVLRAPVATLGRSSRSRVPTSLLI
ncbi:Hypothetical predicted protein [Marmota monax]|uniref:Uncharacterized protein n=1 Tax=Marmota monax TaxID=9995 RepID=A0A5E4BB67_MARMO|nr:hypothetical protein GHT09_015912 [Marmota monax]VTJ66858.1 Hypothetical predicted protein [Marmota monax]